jgi:hypothetical protein
MNKQLPAIALLAIVALVCASRPARAQAVFKVGSFTKSITTSGCPASCTNTVPHGLGVTPQALILWTSGGVSENIGGHSYWWGFGVTDGTTSRSTSASSKYNNKSSTSSASRRSAAAVLTIVQYGSALSAEASFQATNWDATNFYLQWSTNNSSAYIIHFIAIAGLTNAQVLDWTAPASTGTATATLASPQFQPDFVLHFMDYDTNLGATNSCASPNCPADAAFMLGAMDAAGDSWATAVYSKSGVTPTATARGQRTDACIEETDSAATETLRGGTCAVTSTGWTVNFTTNSLGAQHIFSLALQGLNVHVGHFNRLGNTGCPAPCNQTISGLGFQPALALFSSFMTTTQATPVASARVGFGATDNTTQGEASLDDANGISTTFAFSEEFTETFDVNDNDTGSLFARGQIKSGTGGSFNADGFTIDWTTNLDNVATEMLYVVMGPMAATAVTLESFKATRLSDGRTLLEWRTGYEVDNVGFRLYREQNGQRVRITSSLVPGTALIGLLGRGASTGGRTYTWSDTAAPPPAAPPGAAPVQYWLEDVELHGKSTWHGPIAVASATMSSP